MNLSISVFAMPSCINNNGDIFGGWLLSQMDLAGVSICNNVSYGRYVTMTIDRISNKNRNVKINVPRDGSLAKV